MAERVRVRELDEEEGNRLLRIIRRGTGSVVTWRRAQMVLLSAQGMSVARVAEVAFTSEDRVRDVIGNFNTDALPRRLGGQLTVVLMALLILVVNSESEADAAWRTDFGSCV